MNSTRKIIGGVCLVVIGYLVVTMIGAGNTWGVRAAIAPSSATAIDPTAKVSGEISVGPIENGRSDWRADVHQGGGDTLRRGHCVRVSRGLHHLAEGAGVSWSDGTLAVLLGQTSSKGEFCFPELGHTAAWIEIADEGWVSQRIPYFKFVELGNDVLDVHLFPEACITGTVVGPGAIPVPAGFMVIAIPLSLRFVSKRYIERVLQSDPSFPVALTDELGDFRLCGLKPGTQYRVVAGGTGLLSSEDHLVRAPQERITIPVGPLFGAVVVVRDSGGLPLILSDHLSPGLDVMTSRRDGGPKDGKEVPEWMAFLAGIAEGDLTSEPFSAVILERANVSFPRPVYSVSVDLPGYPKTHALVELSSVVEGIGQQPVVVGYSRAEFGDLAVAIRNGGPTLDRKNTLRNAPLKLQLRAKSTGEYFVLDLDDCRSGTYPVGPLPVGTYLWSVVMTAGSPEALVSRGEIEVYPSHQEHFKSEIALDLKDAGQIEYELRDSMGNIYCGPAVIVLGHREPGLEKHNNWSECDFSFPPYVIPALASGSYTVGVRFPGRSDECVGGRELSVVAGGRVSATFPLK